MLSMKVCGSSTGFETRFGVDEVRDQRSDRAISRHRKASFTSGFYSGKLELVTTSISALAGLPNAETGRITFAIQREDFETVSSILASAGFRADTIEKDQAHLKSEWPVIGVLLIACGLLQGGLLAALIYLIVNQTHGDESIVMVILLSAFTGPIAILQLLTGLACLGSKPHSLLRATSILSMIPITPGFPFSLPLRNLGVEMASQNGTNRYLDTVPSVPRFCSKGASRFNSKGASRSHGFRTISGVQVLGHDDYDVYSRVAMGKISGCPKWSRRACLGSWSLAIFLWRIYD